jgi:hypothetical protein
MSKGGPGGGLQGGVVSKKSRGSVLPSDINSTARAMEEVQFPKSPREPAQPRTNSYTPPHYSREASRHIGEVGSISVSVEAFVVSEISNNPKVLVSPDSPHTGLICTNMQENAPNTSAHRVESRLRLNLLSPPGTRSAPCTAGGGGEESVSSLVESWNSGEGPSNGHSVDKARRQEGRGRGGSPSEGAGARQGALTSDGPH